MSNEILEPLLEKSERYLKTDIRYLISGTFWLTFGQGVSSLSSFVSAVLFANLVPKEAYGTYKYVLSIISILSIPALSGIAHAVVQNSARNVAGTYRSGVDAKLIWGSLGTVAALIAGAYYAYNGNWVLGASFLIAAPLIPFVEAFSLWGSYLAGKKAFGTATKHSAFIQITTTAILASAIFWSDSVPILILANLSGYALMRYFVHRKFLRTHPDMREEGSGGDTVSFGKKVTLSNIPGVIFGQVDTLLLWKFAGPVVLASYAFAQATTNPAKTMMKSLVELAQPKFSTQSSENLKEAITRKVLFSFAVFIPLTIIYILIVPVVYALFFPKYLDTVKYAQWLGLIFLFFPMKLYSIAVLTRQYRTPTYILNVVLPLTQALLFVVLIPLYGVAGAIAAVLIQYGVASSLTYYYFRTMRS